MIPGESLDDVVGSDGTDAITTPRILPEYDDHTVGELHPPDDDGLQDEDVGDTNMGETWFPNHEAFGAPSSVEVRCPLLPLQHKLEEKQRALVKGDRVSAASTIFDGDEPGSYSGSSPGSVYWSHHVV